MTNEQIREWREDAEGETLCYSDPRRIIQLAIECEDRGEAWRVAIVALRFYADGPDGQRARQAIEYGCAVVG